MDTITFQCYSCHQILKVGADKAGRKAKCVKCATVLTIPATSTPGLEEPPAAPAAPRGRAQEEIVDMPPSRPIPAPVPRDEEYEREPARGRRDREDDYDDRPRRGRDREDDYDDRPRRGRDRDDDYDDRPRRRGRDRDRDDDY